MARYYKRRAYGTRKWYYSKKTYYRRRYASKEYQYQKIESRVQFMFANEGHMLKFVTNAEEGDHITVAEIMEEAEKFDTLKSIAAQYKVLGINLKLMMTKPPESMHNSAYTPGVIGFFPGVDEIQGEVKWNNVMAANNKLFFTGRENSIINKYISNRTCKEWYSMNDDPLNMTKAGVFYIASQGQGDPVNAYRGMAIFTLYLLLKVSLL